MTKHLQEIDVGNYKYYNNIVNNLLFRREIFNNNTKNSRHQKKNFINNIQNYLKIKSKYITTSFDKTKNNTSLKPKLKL